MPAELELEAADSEDGTPDDTDDTGELALLDDGEFDAGEAGDGAADDEDETVH